MPPVGNQLPKLGYRCGRSHEAFEKGEMEQMS